MPTITPESFTHKSLDNEKVRKLLQFALWQYDGLRHWDREHVVAVLDRLCEAFSLKLRDVVFPFFVAITGQGSGVSVMDAMVILGPDMTRSRLRHALEVLGGVSKKETKEWEKEAAAIFSSVS